LTVWVGALYLLRCGDRGLNTGSVRVLWHVVYHHPANGGGTAADSGHEVFRAPGFCDLGDLLTADIHLATDILATDILTADILTANIHTTDIHTTDIHTTDIHTTDIHHLLTADILTTDVLTANIDCSTGLFGAHFLQGVPGIMRYM